MSEESGISIAPLLNRIFNGETLKQNEAKEVIGYLMDGQLSQMQASALLAALRMRGETVEEITGFAEAMRSRAIRVVPNVNEPLLDIVGTGGTGISTFNISTATIFVVAAAGIKIAKHGNRGVTRKSGSADVLEALNVNLDMNAEMVGKCIEEVGVAFIYAKGHHPAMRFVGPIRADLQARTIFNSLGPLTNPANATRQLMGSYDPALTETFAEVLSGLGIEHALVVHGDGLDELCVSAENTVSEVKDGKVTNYTLKAEDVGLGSYPFEDILGGSPEENAKTIRKVISGEIAGAKRAIVQLNAGAALYVGGKAIDITEGVQIAGEIMDSGKALEKLDTYIAFTQQN